MEQRRSVRVFWRWIAAILCVLLGTAYAAPAKKWSFVPLGGLSNRGSMAEAINNRGAIVGTKSPGSFLYEDGVFTSLEDIPQVRAAGWTQLFPRDISDRGWITGYGFRPAGPAQGEAFLLIPR